MRDDPVTVAVFGDHTQAIAARIELEAAGIPAFIADENLAGGLFTAAAALGGLKLQVPTSRLEESLKLLEERLPGGGGTVDWSEVDVGSPESEVDGEDPSDDELEATHPPTKSEDPIPEADDIAPTQREDRANRLMISVAIGIVCLPVLLLGFWRLIQVFVSTERLRPEYARKAKRAGFIIVAATTFWLWLIRFGWSTTSF